LNKRADCIYIDLMRRLALFAVAIAVAYPAFSFNPSRHTGTRVALLQEPIVHGGEYEDRIAANVRHQLVRELRDRGFDAYDARISYADLRREPRADADLYVEILPGDNYAYPTGGVGVRTSNVAVDVGIIVARVAADLRIYDGRTLDLVAKRHLRHENVTVVPTAVGAGTYRMSVWFALPVVQYLRYRSAVADVVREAATIIADGR
jgi:hypothetical protein